MRRVVLVLIILSGLAAVAVSAYLLVQDMAALNREYARFEQLSNSAASMRSLFLANAHQNVFRINAFADGMGVLLGAILAAIGIHGLCLIPRQLPHASGGKEGDER